MNSSIKVLLLSLIVSTGVFNSSGFTHVNFRLPEGYSQLEYLESSMIRGEGGVNPHNDSDWQSFVNKLNGYGAIRLEEIYNQMLGRY